MQSQLTFAGQTRELASLDEVQEFIKKLKKHFNEQSEIGYEIYPEESMATLIDFDSALYSFFGVEDATTAEDMEKRMILSTLVHELSSMMRRLTEEHDEHWNTEQGKRGVDKVYKEYAALLPYLKRHSDVFHEGN